MHYPDEKQKFEKSHFKLWQQNEEICERIELNEKFAWKIIPDIYGEKYRPQDEKKKQEFEKTAKQ